METLKEYKKREEELAQTAYKYGRALLLRKVAICYKSKWVKVIERIVQHYKLPNMDKRHMLMRFHEVQWMVSVEAYRLAHRFPKSDGAMRGQAQFRFQRRYFTMDDGTAHERLQKRAFVLWLRWNGTRFEKGAI